MLLFLRHFCAEGACVAREGALCEGFTLCHFPFTRLERQPCWRSALKDQQAISRAPHELNVPRGPEETKNESVKVFY